MRNYGLQKAQHEATGGRWVARQGGHPPPVKNSAHWNTNNNDGSWSNRVHPANSAWTVNNNNNNYPASTGGNTGWSEDNSNRWWDISQCLPNLQVSHQEEWPMFRSPDSLQWYYSAFGQPFLKKSFTLGDTLTRIHTSWKGWALCRYLKSDPSEIGQTNTILIRDWLNISSLKWILHH